MVGLTYQTLGRASASAYFCPVMFLCFLANGNEYTHKTYQPLSVRFALICQLVQCDGKLGIGALNSRIHYTRGHVFTSVLFN